MPVYSFQALDPTGKTSKGELSASDEVDALDRLARRGLTPVSLSLGASNGPWWNREVSLSGQSKIATPELETFFDHLGTMLGAKIPLSKALRHSAKMAASQATKKDMNQLADAVENGTSLAEAVETLPRKWPDRLKSLIRVGEIANNLPSVATNISAMLKSEAKTRRDVQQALIYPIILIGMSFFVIGILVFYLAPTLVPVFVTAGAEPPLTIRIMMAIRISIVEGWPILLTGAGVLVLAVSLLRRQLAQALRNLAMKLPIIGKYHRQRSTLRFCQTLYLMLASGGTLTGALQVAIDTSEDGRWKNALQDALKDITGGATLRDSLLAENLLDPTANTILETGEESDSIKDVLLPLIATLESQLAQTRGVAVKLITPVLTLVLGLMVGAIILSTITAIMDLNDVVV